MLGFRNRYNNDIRIRPEVKEIQDDFLNTYRRVLDNQKNWVKRYSEEVTPQNQKDFGVIESIETKKDNLLKILQDKLNLVDSIDKNLIKVTGSAVQSRKVVEEFGKSYDIIKPYNDIIRSYLDPEINSKTREEIKSKLQELVPLINQIIYLTDNVFKTNFFTPPYNAAKEQIGKKFLNPMITTFLALLVMQKNLFRGTYSVIDKPQLDIQYKSWLSSLKDDKRNFVISIENPSGNESKKAIKRRQKLIEEDRGFPMSEGEQLALHNSIFGVSSSKQYTPDELKFLEAEAKRDAEFSERRQEEIEGRTREAQLRIMAGLQPVEITPEVPQLPPPVDSLGPEDVTKMQRERLTESIEQSFYDFLQQKNDEINKALEIIQPTKNTGGNANTQRKRIKTVISKIVEIYKEGYQIIANKPPSFANIQELYDNIIYGQLNAAGNPILSDAYLNSGNPRSTLPKRQDIYDALDNVYAEMIDSLQKKLETLRDNILSGVVTGRGKPVKKITQAIHYNDADNDPYLIR